MTIRASTIVAAYALRGVRGQSPLGEGVVSNEVRGRGTTALRRELRQTKFDITEPYCWGLSETKDQSSPFYYLTHLTENPKVLGLDM